MAASFTIEYIASQGSQPEDRALQAQGRSRRRLLCRGRFRCRCDCSCAVRMILCVENNFDHESLLLSVS